MAQVYARYPQDREAASSTRSRCRPPRIRTTRPTPSSRIGRAGREGHGRRAGSSRRAHYIIHGYDYPTLAQRGLAAARRYDKFAPAVPHALHMPSHIYVLLGMWPETIQGNLAAAAAEKNRGNPTTTCTRSTTSCTRTCSRGRTWRPRRCSRRAAASWPTSPRGSRVRACHRALRHRGDGGALDDGARAVAGGGERRAAPEPLCPHRVDDLLRARHRRGAHRQCGPGPGRCRQARRASRCAAQRKNTYWAEQVEIQRRAAAAWVARAEGKNDEALA